MPSRSARSPLRPARPAGGPHAAREPGAPACRWTTPRHQPGSPLPRPPTSTTPPSASGSASPNHAPEAGLAQHTPPTTQNPQTINRLRNLPWRPTRGHRQTRCLPATRSRPLGHRRTRPDRPPPSTTKSWTSPHAQPEPCSPPKQAAASCGSPKKAQLSRATAAEQPWAASPPTCQQQPCQATGIQQRTGRTQRRLDSGPGSAVTPSHARSQA